MITWIIAEQSKLTSPIPVPVQARVPREMLSEYTAAGRQGALLTTGNPKDNRNARSISEYIVI